MSSKAPKTIDFEKSLDQLTKLIEKMERGNLSLEESLKQFEKGISLVRECQHALTQAEQKVQILTKENNTEIVKPYQHESNSDE